MAKVKAGTVSVEIMLDKDQFDKDFKAAQREVSAAQKQLSMELERNKVKFSVDGMDKDWVDKMFGNTAIGRIRNARREVDFLNQQIGTQSSKVKQAEFNWQELTRVKGAAFGATQAAERAFLREQMALVGLKKQLDGTTTSTDVMISSLKNTAITAAAVASAIAAAYATMAKSATEWGQSVNDIVDATGMGDEAAAKLLGTMSIVGLSTEDATGALVKMARSVDTAFKAQTTAAKAGKESEDVFTRFGIAIRDSSGNLLDQATILSNIQTVHAGMRDGLEKTALEMEIFGRSGYKMNDFLNLSKEQMTEYTQRIEKMGLAVGDSAKYENLNKQLNEMSLALKGIAVTITGDNIPAITQLIAKMSELSAWANNNKDGLTDLRNTLATLGGWIAKPFTVGLELGIAGLKKFIESVNEAAQSSKQPIAESTLDDVSAAAKVAEAAAKKQADINRAKVAAEKDLIFAQRELQDAVMTLQGQTLAVTLNNIAREREAWIKKTQDEVAATKWAEEAKAKAFKDAIDARLGPEVAAAKDAIKNGTDVGEAIRKAAETRKADEKATYEATQAVKDYYGLKAPGDTKTVVQVDEIRGMMTSFKETVKDIVIPKDRYGRTEFDPYKPTGGQVIPGQNLTITMPISVNVNGMDAQSAQQLGEIAAQQIIPAVQSAVNAAATQYGGNK